LAGAAAAQLAVDAARLVALGADHVEAADLVDAGPEFDVGTAAGHVGGDGDGAALSGAGDDLGLLLVELGVEHGVHDALALEQAAEDLGGLDGDGADEHGLAAAVGHLDLLDDGLVLVAAGLEDGVVAVDADAGLVRRDDDDGQLVDLEKLGGFGLGCAGHAREFFVHAEVVLDRDRGVGPRLALDGDVFLGFDGLVEPVGPATTRHHTAGVFVDDHDLAFLDDVLDVAFVQGVGAQQLRDGVDVLGDDGVVVLRFELPGLALLGRKRGVLVEVGKLGGEVGQDEGVGIVRTQPGAADFAEVGLVLALVDDKEELLLDLVELVLVEVGVHLRLDLVEELAPLGVFHEAQEELVFRVPHFDLEELEGTAAFFVRGVAGLFENVLGLGGEAVDQAHLVVDETFDGGLEAGKGLLALDGRRTGDDQRRARFIDEDGVDFVDDAVPVVALDLVFLARGHAVVAQIIEAELRGGAIRDVAAVHLATDVVGHLLLDTADTEAEELIEVAHPLGIATREVVVGGDELGVAADEGVEIKRERGDEGFAFARGHLGNLALVQGDATDELHIVVDHVPGELVVAHDHGAPAETTGAVFDDGKRLGKNLVKGFPGLQAGAKLVRLGAELVIREQLVLLFELVDTGDDGPARFEELTIMAAGKFLEQPGEHEGARR